METKTYNVYKFKELSEEGKENAINHFRNYQDLSFTWDCTQKDAELIGLKLLGTDRGYMQGRFIDTAENTIDKILENHGKDCETYKTAMQYKKELKKIVDEDLKEDIREEFLKSILEDYRIIQEKDEEYQNSDEAIIETIEANDYNFLENGTID